MPFFVRAFAIAGLTLTVSACCSLPRPPAKQIDPNGNKIVPVDSAKPRKELSLDFTMPGRGWTLNFDVRNDDETPARTYLKHQDTGSLILVYRFDGPGSDPSVLVEAVRRAGMSESGASFVPIPPSTLNPLVKSSYAWEVKHGIRTERGRVSGLIVNDDPKVTVLLLGKWPCDSDRDRQTITADFRSVENSIRVVSD